MTWPVAHGGRAMRFDLADFAAFDIHVLKRKGAAEDYPEAIAAEAARRVAGMDDARQKKLAGNVIAGLAGHAGALGARHAVGASRDL